MSRVRFSAYWSPALGTAIKRRNRKPYPITFGTRHADYLAFEAAIAQGIDSHLEAVKFEQAGNRFEISADTLPVLVRRLLESGGEAGESFGSSICETLGIELI